MYCPNCGHEMPDDAVFCLNCGADLRQNSFTAPRQNNAADLHQNNAAPPRQDSRAAQPATPAAPAAAKKKKFNWGSILIAILIILAGKFLGEQVGRAAAKSVLSSSSDSTRITSSAASNSTSTGSINVGQDLIIRHNVYVLPDSSDSGLRIYAIVYYGSDSHIMTGLTVEYVYAKSAGFTLDSIKAAEFEKDFPSFASVTYSENSDSVIATCKMKDLKNKDRIRRLINYDIVELPGSQKADVIDADSYMQSFLDDGWQTANYSDYSFLHFD